VAFESARMRTGSPHAPSRTSSIPGSAWRIVSGAIRRIAIAFMLMHVGVAASGAGR
jgi:hypothetical protein